MEENCSVAKEVVVLPGFRFHPTDEELVGFYLLRKVQGKSISADLITQLDIYKYDPWDLPKMSSSSIGEKEWYFFCKRGRKYRNSVRPNRVTVTGSGFWKATGIDKPIHSSSNSDNKSIIGLKKCLVYYTGNAAKGTKTDWMMHEFRLIPPTLLTTHHHVSNCSSNNSTNHHQEAEVWTICRILRRNASHKIKRTSQDWKHTINNIKTRMGDANSTTDSFGSAESDGKYVDIMGFCKGKEVNIKNNLQEFGSHNSDNIDHADQLISFARSPITSSSSSDLWAENGTDHEFLRNGNWDELGSVINGLALDRSP